MSALAVEQESECQVRPGLLLLSLLLLTALLGGCGFGIPVKDPTQVRQQVEQSMKIRIGESSRADVRTLLGEPWLESDFWHFELYRAESEQKELSFFVFFTPPVPIGVFTWKIGGFVLVSYDSAGHVAKVSAGNASRSMGDQDALMLRAGELNLVIEPLGDGSPQLIADPARFAGFLALRRASPVCTLILACSRPASPERWPDESCPDRVAVDDGEPLDPKPLYAVCDPASHCPPTAVPGHMFARVPLWVPFTLPPGQHRLKMSSSVFKGNMEAAFECAAGEVRYATVSGQVNWHWWGPRSSTLDATVSWSADSPADWSSRSVLLYRHDRWLAAPVPADRAVIDGQESRNDGQTP